WGNYQQLYLKVYQGQTDAFHLSFIGTMVITILLGAAVFLPFLIQRIGYRRTMMIGAIITPLGLILASFATQLVHLYLSQGVMFGFGCGFVYAPAMSIPSLWFKRNRSLATSLGAAGAGIGALVISPLTELLFDKLGYRMALRIEGAMGFGLLALAAALAYSNPDISSIKQPPFRIVHRDLLDGSYILMLIYCLLCFVGHFGTFFLAPPYAAHLGYSAIDGAEFVAIMSGMNTLSRVITGILADRYGNINVMFSCALTSGKKEKKKK
ncbi:major facilitator superfamily domain-containing protein, partial [Chlamydoabsidia padenii]